MSYTAIDFIYVASDLWSGYILFASHDLEALKAECDKLDRSWSSEWKLDAANDWQRYFSIQGEYDQCIEIEQVQLVKALDKDTE